MIIKELELIDFEKYHGFYETLNHLAPSPEMTIIETQEILKKLNTIDGHLFVAIVDNEIVSCVTLLIEPKFIRKGGICGHIEDVVTRIGFERRGIATAVLAKTLEYAESRNCYKIILDCEEELIPFYARSGFKQKGLYISKRYI